MDEHHRKIVLETLETVLNVQLKSVRQLLDMPDDTSQLDQEAPRRQKKRKSLADLSIEILTETAEPLHVNDLVELLQKRFGRITDRDSLSSALAKKIKKGLIRQVAPACYAGVREGTE